MTLEVKNITFSYGNGPVISGLSLRVKEREFVSLIGPFGAAKKHTVPPDWRLCKTGKGEITWNGQSIVGKRGNFAYMPHNRPSSRGGPWRKTLLFSSELNHQKMKPEHIHRYLENAGLSGTESLYPHELSGGMQQRVAFLRTLASGKEWLLLDEPFGALDALTRTHMQKWLDALLKKERRTVLFITHSIEEALLLSDRIYILTKRPMQVYQELKVPFPKENRFSLRGDKTWESLPETAGRLVVTGTGGNGLNK